MTAEMSAQKIADLQSRYEAASEVANRVTRENAVLRKDLLAGMDLLKEMLLQGNRETSPEIIAVQLTRVGALLEQAGYKKGTLIDRLRALIRVEQQLVVVAERAVEKLKRPDKSWAETMLCDRRKVQGAEDDD
jgi:hypothetical protein